MALSAFIDAETLCASRGTGLVALLSFNKALGNKQIVVG